MLRVSVSINHMSKVSVTELFTLSVSMNHCRRLDSGSDECGCACVRAPPERVWQQSGHRQEVMHGCRRPTECGGGGYFKTVLQRDTDTSGHRGACSSKFNVHILIAGGEALGDLQAC